MRSPVEARSPDQHPSDDERHTRGAGQARHTVRRSPAASMDTRETIGPAARCQDDAHGRVANQAPDGECLRSRTGCPAACARRHQCGQAEDERRRRGAQKQRLHSSPRGRRRGRARGAAEDEPGQADRVAATTTAPPESDHGRRRPRRCGSRRTRPSSGSRRRRRRSPRRPTGTRPARALPARGSPSAGAEPASTASPRHRRGFAGQRRAPPAGRRIPRRSAHASPAGKGAGAPAEGSWLTRSPPGAGRGRARQHDAGAELDCSALRRRRSGGRDGAGSPAQAPRRDRVLEEGEHRVEVPGRSRGPDRQRPG